MSYFLMGCVHKLAEQCGRGLLEVRTVVFLERDSGPSLMEDHTTQQVFNPLHCGFSSSKQHGSCADGARDHPIFPTKNTVIYLVLPSMPWPRNKQD